MTDENYDFSVNDGNIVFSTERIEFVFVSDEIRSGSFDVFCQSETPMLGVCHSNNPRMKVINPQFKGLDANIEFEFDSTGMEPGDICEGEFIILTNKGEYTLPFACAREMSYVNSTLGHIKNLFHFANLAQADWAEAVNVFYSNAFISMLTGNDAKYKNLYRGLSEIVLNEQNMDEFLVAIKKKERVTYSISTNDVSVVNPQGEMSKVIQVHKNSWGYISIDVTSEGNFIYIPKNHFTYEDFVGDDLNIEFKILPDFCLNGRNFGKITIETPQGKEDIIIKIDKNRKDVTKLENHNFKKILDELFRFYIDFSFDRISQEEWCQKSMELAERIIGTKEHNIISKLFQAQINVISNNSDDANWFLSQVAEAIDKDRYSDETYGYYMYISSLISKDADTVAKALRMIKKYLAKDPGNSILAWLVLYLTEEFYSKTDRKLEFLVEQFRLGNNSPLLYIEGINIYNENPSLLMKLEEYEEAVLRFAYKYKAISANLGERIQFLVSREKEFKQIWFDIMKYQYAYMPSKELLNTIIVYLCKGNKIGPEYFDWYSQGIYSELRITRLYEFYMDCLSLDYDNDLPQMVMMYFAYQNDLDYKKKAFLYKNVLSRKAKYPEIAVSYRDNLEEFCKEQISLKHINDDLIYLYAKVLNPTFVTEDIANECVTLQFMRRITVPDNVKRVILIHEKIVGEQRYVPDGNLVFCPIYSKDYNVFYEDEDGARTVVPEENISEPVLNNPMLLDKISHLVSQKIGLILCRLEGEFAFENVTEDNIFDYERLLSSEVVTYSFKKKIIKELMKYYYDNDYNTELEDLLSNVKTEIFEGQEKNDFIRILIARGMYDTAFNVLSEYGPEHIDSKYILRLVSRLLERTDFEETDRMIAYAQYIYRHGKYDQNILTYLADNFEGTAKELRNLLKDSDDFGIDTFILLENIIIQLLFTNSFCGEKVKLLKDYIECTGSYSLESAFLSRCAYDYFVNGVITDDFIFQRIEKNIMDDELVSRISKLALAKYYAGLEPQYWNKVLIERIINEELERKVCFPFFITFESFVDKLQSYSDFSFVEYNGNSSSHVVIHYCIEHDDGQATEYKKEEMNRLYDGIFVKSFILFCGDTVQYYITEEHNNMEQLTQSSILTRSESDTVTKPWRFTTLNDCIVAKQMSDYVTVENDYMSYIEKDFLTKELFKVF